MAEKQFSVFRGREDRGPSELVRLPVVGSVMEFRSQLLAKLQEMEDCEVVPVNTDILECFHDDTGCVRVRDVEAITSKLWFYPREVDAQQPMRMFNANVYLHKTLCLGGQSIFWRGKKQRRSKKKFTFFPHLHPRIP